MHVYLVRHACPENTTDMDPPLGEEGNQEAKLLGQLFAALYLQPEALKVVSSPLQRARQTAIHICQGIGIADEVDIFPKPEEWSPNTGLINRLMERLQRITEEEGCSEVIVIGHYPYLSKSFAWLVGEGEKLFPQLYGATLCLTCKPGFAQGSSILNWLVTLDLLTRIQVESDVGHQPMAL